MLCVVVLCFVDDELCLIECEFGFDLEDVWLCDVLCCVW